MTKPRAVLLILIVSVGAYANSIGNGFAYDDNHIIGSNPAVTAPTVEQTLLGAYWPNAREGSGLYRPAAIAVFAAQWQAFGGDPTAFHAVSIVSHAAVAVLVLTLLASFVPLVPALAGALLFAVHPVHVEAVANVVGQSEIVAAAAVLLACHLYVLGSAWQGAKRGARLAAIALLYLLGLGAKEIAVTLPVLLVTLELFRASDLAPARRYTRELGLYLSLAAVLATYLILRTAVLGTTTGEVPAPALRGLAASDRVLTALSVWPEYLRLLVFPVDLSADYSPAVLTIATDVTASVLVGLVVIVVLGALAVLLRARLPQVSAGILWFCVTILPVSNLVIPAGVLLAERTLYLPSVGLSFAVAGLVAAWQRTATPRALVPASALGLIVGSLLTVRTTLRNPTWLDTFTVLNTLALEHPESYQSLQSRGIGLERVGDLQGARDAYEAAITLAPNHYGLLIQVAEFYGSRGQYGRAEELLARATRATPELPEAYLLTSEYHIRQGRGREGHAAALEGLARSGPDPRLFALVSESYVAKGDLEGAARARLAALGQAPDDPREHALRLAELYEAMGRLDDAGALRDAY